MICAVVECGEQRAGGAFCDKHFVEFFAAPESRQPNRGPADFVERRWKETSIAQSMLRGNKPGDGPQGDKRTEPPRPTAAHLKMPVIARPIEKTPVVTVPVVVVVETEKERIEKERRAAARQWSADPPADLTEKENLK